MRLRLVLLAGLTSALALSACSSDGGTSSGSTSGAAARASDAAALSRSLRTGLAGLTSAHFTLTGSLGSQQVSGSGDEKITDGALSALQAQASLPGTTGGIGLVVLGSDRYVRLPAGLAPASKPWAKVTASSDDVIVKQLAGVLDAALAAANVAGLDELAAAATSVRRDGIEQVGGAAATKYSLTIDPTKLPDGLAAKAGLGSAAIPATLWLDGQKRPVQVRAKVPLAGQPADVTVTFSKLGDPVTITAPDPSLVAG